MSFDLRADIEDLKRLHPLLQAVPKGLDTAVARALNKTMTGARTDAVAMIRRDYNLKAGLIRADLRIIRANANNLRAVLRGEASPGIPMIDSGVLPKRVPSTVRSKGRYTPAVGISAMIKKGKRTTFPGAFVARMSSGHVGVFHRREDGRKMKAKNRPAIRQMFGPSAIKLLAGDRYDIELEEKIEARWDKDLQHEARNVLRKAGLLK